MLAKEAETSHKKAMYAGDGCVGRNSGVPKPAQRGPGLGQGWHILESLCAVSERGAQSANSEGDLEDPRRDGRAEEEQPVSGHGHGQAQG